ncbi:MAG TPA: flagellar biosynthesis protein FlhA [Bacillota bacterium]|nr:flagellar biosynthesis protein FlhA [Bacillota bacterium]HOK68668.1 flagellar biosynthesis protein FlhA [Bacillota bacterium]HPP84780.1 flagellar biosynthesis protein FlhA [Bacillota bacterium]
MKKLFDNILTVFVICIVFLIIIPLSPTFLDVVIIINIALSLGILLLTMYIKEALEFSVFPSVLLVTTLLRLGINVSSSRLILGNNGYAGHVIKAFGEYVIGGSPVIGFIIFLIIIIAQFIIITKGSERVAEVAARFTLDAMPGKQMAIDADLNSGLIDEETAKARRQKIQREADFYGSMDGASKFIKGDAIVSILIVFVNSIGGIIVGMVQGGQDFSEVLRIYITATVGDGLVAQISALLISTATGMIVTRAASVNDLGTDLKTQIVSYPIAILITGGALIAMAAIPGFPVPLLLLFGALFIFLGWRLSRKSKEPEPAPQEELPVSETEYYKNTENIYSLLNIEPIEVEVGYSLVPLVDESKGGNFLNRVVMLRRQFAEDLGFVVPTVRLRDNAELGISEYVIKIKGEPVARGEVLADRFLAMNQFGSEEEIEGIDTVEPVFQIPAKWITADKRERAMMCGYTVIDPLSVIITHLSEMVKAHAHELFGRRELVQLIENFKKVNKELVEDCIPNLISYADLQKVLCNLLAEQIPIRDLTTILETVSEYASTVKDMDMLTEYVRQALKRTITRKYVHDNTIKVITLNPDIEDLIMSNIKKVGNTSYVSLEPEIMQKIVSSQLREEKRIQDSVDEVIVLTSPVVRFYYKRLIEQFSSKAVVLSFNEINSDINVQSLGTVSIGN